MDIQERIDELSVELNALKAKQRQEQKEKAENNFKEINKFLNRYFLEWSLVSGSEPILYVRKLIDTNQDNQSLVFHESSAYSGSSFYNFEFNEETNYHICDFLNHIEDGSWVEIPAEEAKRQKSLMVEWLGYRIEE